MDGSSYQNPYQRGHADSPLSPDTPQSASYKANVNRTKTRKWVEAKVQSYDGDDWGGDDFGDEPVPNVPALRPGGSRQASYSSNRLPSGPSVPTQPQQQQEQQSPYYQQPPVDKPRDAGPPPTLTIQTQDDQPRVAPPQIIEPDAGAADDTERDPLERKESPPVEASAAQVPPVDSQPAHHEQKPAPFVRPSDIYRRMEQDPTSGPSQPESLPTQEDVGSKVALGSNEPPAPAQPQPVLQHPQPQTSSSDPNSQQHQQAEYSGLYQTTQYADAPQIEEPKRFSTSPQLPDLARMSMFGDDLFSGKNRFSVAAPTPVAPVREEPHSPSPPVSAAAAQPPAEPAREPTPDTGSLTTKTEEPKAVDTTTDESPAVGQPSKSPSLEEDPMLQPPQSRPSLPGEWVSDSAQASDPEPPKELAPPSVRDADDDSAPTEEQPVKAALTDESQQDEPQKDTAPTQSPQPVNTSVDDFVSPQILNRENTLSTIASPSPVKESDKLREEIIRTLSPVRPTDGPGGSGTKSESAQPAGGLSRESTYLHGVYDDYWSASDDKAAHSLMDTIPESKPQAAQNNAELPEIQPLSPRLREPAAEQQLPAADSRPRRFSWEAEAAPAASTDEAPAAVVVEPVAETKPSESDEETPAAEKTEPFRAADGLPSRMAENARMNAPEDASQISHQVSQVSSVPRESNAGVPQPPSPISVASDRPSAEPKSLALTDEKALAASTATVGPGTTTEGVEEGPSANTESKWQPTEAQEEEVKQPELQRPEIQQPQKIMTFREILEMPNTTDRIAKYNETRQQFANMDSGLNDWLVHVKTQPENANASGSFQALLQGDAQFGGTFGGPGQPPKSPTGAQPAPQQQPYYQQYLNASSPTTSSAPPGRNPLSGLTGGSPASDFKHSSGQVGAKGKELLLAAGKAGKGLLSKGKDKLRRDKVFP